MAIDMSQFYQVFFEEAEEHLANMEQLLLETDPDDFDNEQMNAIFRAAHSIKGSAGTFGFQDLAQVTHELETMLDLVRKGELDLTSEMVDASLEAGDLLKMMLDAHRGGPAAATEDIEFICRHLRELSGAQAPVKEEAEPVVCQAEEAVAAAETSEAVEQNVFVASFKLDARAVANPAVIENMLEDLREMGQVEIVAKPEAESVDGDWTLKITTSYADSSLTEIIEYVAEHGSLKFEHEGAVQVSAADGSFGLFNEDHDVDSTAATVEAVVEEDDSFGLFEPVAAPVTVEATPAPAAPVVAEDDSFGFFEPLPPVVESNDQELAVAEASPAAVTPVARATASKEDRAAKPASNDAGSIRVGVEKVDQMINLVGELVITQAMIAQSASTLDPVIYERLMNGIAQLERNTRDLQESVMSIRMMPISVTFSRFPRVVRDLSRKLGKQVRLVMSGESTELDKGLIERIADPLTHLVRNSLDHGIEMPEKRLAAGKPEEGTITLKASHQSGNIVIEVGDDGGGLNRDRILSKARERGLPVSDNMTDSEVWNLIFEAGFSTADQITEVSGRGVGMDVVRKNITAMGGKVEIDSVYGVGTRITVRLPLTLAILDGMSIRVGHETYIVPLNYVVESLQPAPGQVRTISGAGKVIMVRGDYLPVVPLHEVFNCHGAETDYERGIMVVMESDGAKSALFVDELLGQYQVVIKSLEANYRRVPGISGATIMGDGKVALILDVASLMNVSKLMTEEAA